MELSGLFPDGGDDGGVEDTCDARSVESDAAFGDIVTEDMAFSFERKGYCGQMSSIRLGAELAGAMECPVCP